MKREVVLDWSQRRHKRRQGPAEYRLLTEGDRGGGDQCRPPAGVPTRIGVALSTVEPADGRGVEPSTDRAAWSSEPVEEWEEEHE